MTAPDGPPPPDELLGPPLYGTCPIYQVILHTPWHGTYCICLTEDEAKRVQLRLAARGFEASIVPQTLLYSQPTPATRTPETAAA